jgi:type VI protein secretion system component VasK
METGTIVWIVIGSLIGAVVGLWLLYWIIRMGVLAGMRDHDDHLVEVAKAAAVRAELDAEKAHADASAV